MSLLETLGASVKAAAASLAPLSSTPFSNWGMGLLGGSSVAGVMPPGGGELGFVATPGSRDDYASDVGDVSLNAVVSASVSAIAEAFCSTPIYLEQRQTEKWNRVEMHPCIELLRYPNRFYGADQMWEAEIAGELITGSGYFRAVFNEARTQPVELWHEGLVAPLFDSRVFTSSYFVWVDWRPFPLGAAALYGQPEDPFAGRRVDYAIHFRYRLNRRNPRFGESPLGAVIREIAGDNVASTWHTAVLRNGAGVSFFVTAKDGVTITAKQMEDILSQAERRLRREGAGRIAGSNLAVDFNKVSFSPEELALDKLPSRYESRICAVLKTPPMVLNLLSGNDTKTYSNMGEAIDDFWQRTIIPYQKRKASELAAQLFPLFGMDGREWRLGFDRSEIAALQDDESKLYGRLTQAVAAGWMTPNEARERAKLPTLPGADALVSAKPADAPASPDDASPNETASDTDPASVLDADDSDPDEQTVSRATKAQWQEDDHPREDNGEFSSTGGGSGGDAPQGRSPRVSAEQPGKKAAGLTNKHLVVDASIQRYCEEHNEREVAHALKGQSLPDSEPVDVKIPPRRPKHGIELKTMVTNKRGAIRMSRSARARKAAWEKETGATLHTVVLDDRAVYNANGEGQHDESKRVIYYRRGCGNLSVASMHKCKNMTEVRKLMAMSDDELPSNAKRLSDAQIKAWLEGEDVAFEVMEDE